MSRWLLLQCGERRCALPVADVLSVAPVAMASPLPRTPVWVEGIAGYGRSIVPQVALGALLGEAAAGALAVIARSGAGEIALRVDAVDRVIDLVERPAAGPDGQGIVAGTVRRGRFDVGLLDLSRLTIPIAALRVNGRGETEVTDEAALPSDEAAHDLVCAVEGGFIALPLARVLSIEAVGHGQTLALCDSDGRPCVSGGAAMAVSVSLAGGWAVLGVTQVLGPRRPGTPGYHHARLLDCDGLTPAGASMRPGEPSQAEPQTRVMYLLGAGQHQVLLPASKALFAGAIEHWRPLPGGRHGADGILPLGGAILPAFDLGRLLGDAPCERSMAMALDARGSHWAIACDSISERHGRIEGRPLTRDGLATLGQARIAEGLIPVLDADRLALPGGAS